MTFNFSLQNILLLKEKRKMNKKQIHIFNATISLMKATGALMMQPAVASLIFNKYPLQWPLTKDVLVVCSYCLLFIRTTLHYGLLVKSKSTIVVKPYLLYFGSDYKINVVN